MKLYAVVFDTYDDSWGAEIHLFGVYDTREKAVERIKQLRLDRKIYVPVEDNCCIEEIELNADCNEYLGGYIE